MNTYKFALFGIIISLLLNGCTQNPVLNSTPDKFALSVNQFENKDIENNGLAENCGKFYLTPQQNTTSYFESAMQTQCNYKMEQLAKYLQQFSEFNSVTAKDLELQETWEFYFKSQYTIGKTA